MPAGSSTNIFNSATCSWGWIALRDAVRDLARGDVAKAAGIAREIRTTARLEVQTLEGGSPSVPPVLSEAKEAQLALKLEALAPVLPGHGRVALAYMPEEVKAQAREVAEWLLSQPGFVQSAERFSDLGRELASHYTGKPEALWEAGEKAYDDLRDRVVQVVLRSVALEKLGR